MGEALVLVNEAVSGVDALVEPADLTHKPPDSWERIERDATISPRDYCGIVLNWAILPENDDAHYIEGMACDLVRRCKALAERERGE